MVQKILIIGGTSYGNSDLFMESKIQERETEYGYVRFKELETKGCVVRFIPRHYSLGTKQGTEGTFRHNKDRDL